MDNHRTAQTETTAERSRHSLDHLYDVFSTILEKIGKEISDLQHIVGLASNNEHRLVPTCH